MSRFQTDSLNPTALNTGVLGRKRVGPSTHSFLADDPSSSVNPNAERDKFAADWNVRIDREMRAVSGGLKELVELADIGPSPAAHTSIPSSLHLQIRTAQLIRATQSIRDMAHELRLMLLLSDEVGTAARRDAEAAGIAREAEERRGEVMRRIKCLMGSGSEDAGVSGNGNGSGVGMDEVERRKTDGKEERSSLAEDRGETGAAQKAPEREDGGQEAEAEAEDVDEDDDSDEFEEL